jgi:hypothetical protein
MDVDGRTDGRMEGGIGIRTDEQIEGQTDKQMDR